jgi:hypothetical protein
MNSVDHAFPLNNQSAELDEEEDIELQIKKCCEQNQQKLKQAKNLEDLIKIKLSTVQVSSKDNNLFWRNLINRHQKAQEDLKKVASPEDSPSPEPSPSIQNREEQVQNPVGQLKNMKDIFRGTQK